MITPGSGSSASRAGGLVVGRRSFLAGAGALTAWSLLAACTGDDALPPPTGGVTPAPTEDPLLLLRDAVRASPDHLSARAAEAVATGDAEAIVTLVRDGVSVLPHRIPGAAETDRRWGPAAVLRCGAGTPRDRMELLATLLTAAGAEATVVGARRPEGLTAEVLRRSRRPPFSPDTTLLQRAGAAAGTVSVAPTSESDSPVVDTVDAEVDRLTERLLAALPPDAAAVLDLPPDPLPDRLPLVRYVTPAATHFAFAVGDLAPTTASPVDLAELDRIEPGDRVTVTVHARSNPPPGSRTPTTELVELVSGSWPLEQLLGRPLSLSFDAMADPDTVLSAGLGAIPVRMPVLRPQAGMPDAPSGSLPAVPAGAPAFGTPITLWGDLAEPAAATGGDPRVVGPAGTVSGLAPAALAAARARVAAATLRVDASAFPRLDLELQVTDAAGGSVDGLDAASFTVTEDGRDLPITLLANGPDVRRPRVLLLVDGSVSVGSNFASPEAQGAFGRTLSEALVAAAVRTPFDLQVVSLGGEPSTAGWAPPDPAAIEPALTTPSTSAIWSSLATAGEAGGASAVVLLSDNLSDEDEATVAAAQRRMTARPSPVISVALGSEGGDATARIVQLTGGLALDPGTADFGGRLADAIDTRLMTVRTTTTYRLATTAAAAGPSDRTISATIGDSAGTVTAAYTVPTESDRIAPPGFVGLSMTVEVAGTTDTRRLAGAPDPATGQPDPADSADTLSCLTGLTTLLVEPVTPTPAAAMDDAITAHLTWAPLRGIVTEPTAAALSGVAADVRRFPVPLVTLLAPSAGLGGNAATTPPAAMRATTTVLLTQRPDPSTAPGIERLLATVDLSPALNRVTALDTDPTSALRAAVRESLLLSAGEGLLSAASAHARLRDRDVVLLAPGVSLPYDRLAGLDAAAAAQLQAALQTYGSQYRLVPSSGPPEAFWVIDPASGTTIAVLPDGRGGAAFDLAALYQALNLALVVLGLGCTLGGVDASKGAFYYYSCLGLTVASVVWGAVGVFPPFGGVGPGTPFGAFATVFGALVVGTKAPPIAGRIGISLVVLILYLISVEQF